MPLVIEIVDREEKITAFLPILGKLMSSGLVTIVSARVLLFEDRALRITEDRT
ncbi:DUF190 domain-containing protein [Phaeovulum sp. NW3]|uniref:DUF190 domain-containing protein n=1 Tax=Phaeovulum sp. NW3 TaxID=2934933 RepID=UPI0020213BBB|nr:DUF190 domain-containing protein [Phaeovulum sp. NW3]